MKMRKITNRPVYNWNPLRWIFRRPKYWRATLYWLTDKGPEMVTHLTMTKVPMQTLEIVWEFGPNHKRFWETPADVTLG